MVTDFLALRALFPLLAEKIYLNSCSYGALADPVRAAFARIDHLLAVGANWDVWVAKNEAVRKGNCGHLAHRCGRGCGDDLDHRRDQCSGECSISPVRVTPSSPAISNFRPMRKSGTRKNRAARAIHVHADDTGDIPAERFAEAIDSRTKIVAVTHVCFGNGALLDIAEIARIAHERGALLLLNCYQSVGSMTVDVKALGVDFAVGGMYKYLLNRRDWLSLCARLLSHPDVSRTHSGWFAKRYRGDGHFRQPPFSERAPV